MDKEAELRKAICAAASAMKIDLADPVNAFTLWTDGPVHCGSRSNLDEAIALAHQYPHLKNLVILSANPEYGLLSVADDRVKAPRGPGSGN
jgi:hypothetical protein